MKEWFLNSTISFLKKHNNYSEKEIKKLRYGLEGIYLTLTKTIVIFLVALLLGIFKEVLICLILFNIIRYFAFGFHAEKSSQCLIISLFNFILIPYIFLNINTSLSIKLIICGLCLLLILIFAPADTIKRPLKNKKKRLIRKALTFLTGLLYTLLVVVFKDSYIADLLVSCLVIAIIVVNPVTYFIFKQPYNNYKKIS